MSDLATADLSLLAAASTELQASKWLIRGRQVSKLVQVGGSEDSEEAALSGKGTCARLPATGEQATAECRP